MRSHARMLKMKRSQEKVLDEIPQDFERQHIGNCMMKVEKITDSGFIRLLRIENKMPTLLCLYTNLCYISTWNIAYIAACHTCKRDISS